MRTRISGRVLGYRAVQVDRFITLFAAEVGRAPVYDEIRAGTGIRTRGEVSRIVDSLERRGLLSRVGRGRVRRISLQTANLRQPILVINGLPS
jgi:predicted transcriptional regulator of viral defense system